MTKKQQEEFARLELSYLDEVQKNDPEAQLRQMEVIFYWIKKQITEERMKIILQLPLINGRPGYDGNPAEEITTGQKGEFTFLQMAMLKVACRMMPDKMGMVAVEKKMREWIDKQITASINRLIKPRMRIIPDKDTLN